MPADTPLRVHERFAKSFSAADLDAIIALYEPSATLIHAPGQSVTGTDAIREGLARFLALKGQFNMEPGGKVIESDGIALLFSRWTLVGTDPEGNRVELSGLTSDAVRRQPDGSWLIVIDNPFGTAGVEV